MAENVKRKALVFLFLALMITLVIGAGLPRLKFQPGMPLPSLGGGQVAVATSVDAPAVGVTVNTFVFMLFLIIMGVFLLVLIYRMVKGTDWKKLLSDLFSFLAILLALVVILLLALSLLPKSQGAFEAEPLPPPRPIVTAPLGPVPPLVIWLVGIGLFCTVVLAGIWMIRSKHRSVPGLWELEAEKARQALLAGGDLKDVILRCYQRMSQALQQEQGIEREAFMTTGEFERLLAAKGVPHDPVHQLTQLFEAVRYGNWQPNAGDEQRGLHSLDAILEFSHVGKQES
ncbi:MAG: DUF4129 domain-containing protein [Chloroflexi bacterium]|nr:DUF4129 domain-containing protein [Chloroflexota bacterium]